MVGDAGIVVNPEATAEIVDILINLEQDSRLRKYYSQKGQIHAAKYTWSSCVDRLIAAFEKLA